MNGNINCIFLPFYISIVNSLELQIKTHKEKQTEIKFWDVCVYYALISTISSVLARATPPYMRLLDWDLQGQRSSLFS